MSGLVGIIYGWDSSGKPLSVLINPDLVTTTESTSTTFSIVSKAVNATVDLSVTNPGQEAYGTAYNFTGPTGSGDFMNTSWQKAVNNTTTTQTFIFLDFASQGYITQKRILIYP